MQNKAHGQNINFLLVNPASRQCIGSRWGWPILNSQCTEYFCFLFFCTMLRDRWFIKTNFAPSPQHPGWRRAGSNEHATTRFMPTSLRGVPNQNLWFMSSFSRSEHRHSITDGQEQECELIYM